MRIVVKKSSEPSHWYSERIGEIFEVLDVEPLRYRIRTKRPSIGHFYVLICDCEEIEKEGSDNE